MACFGFGVVVMVLGMSFYKHLTYLGKFSDIVTKPGFLPRTVGFQKKLHKVIGGRAGKRGFSFVYIGANDGRTGSIMYDYVREFDWSGVMVEPIPRVFEKLKKNYLGQSNLRFENSAVSEKNGEIGFNVTTSVYSSSIHDREWFSSKQNPIRRLLKFVSPEPRKITVKTLTLASLYKKYKIKSLDFLHMDTEGYDYPIVMQIDFEKLRPGMILIEVSHMSDAQIRECRELFEGNGYQVESDGWDMLAY